MDMRVCVSLICEERTELSNTFGYHSGLLLGNCCTGVPGMQVLNQNATIGLLYQYENCFFSTIQFVKLRLSYAILLKRHNVALAISRPHIQQH